MENGEEPELSIETEEAPNSKKFVSKYSRGDLEALRYVDEAGQTKKWRQLCQRLEPRVLQEYHQLAEHDRRKMKGKIEDQRLWERNKEQDKHVPCEGSSASVDEEHDDYDEDEDEADDDDYDNIQRPAFAVDGEPDFESGSPQDGWEYLRRVRWEASLMPKVRIAKVDTSMVSEQTPYMPKIPEIPHIPEDLRPSRTWTDQFLADFSHIRKAFSEREISPDLIDFAPAAISGEDSETSASKNSPTVSEILKMDSVARAANLRNRVKAFEFAGSAARDDCAWIFALCAAVDVPLDAEMGSCMRRLLRKSSMLLSKKTDQFDEEVAMLNILIAISGRFFGQSEENSGLIDRQTVET